MADEKIRFSIGSVFTDEGFKKANASLKDTSTQAMRSANVMRNLGDVLGTTDGTVGKLAKGVQGLSGVMSAMAGGPIAVLVASVTAITSAIVGWKKAADEAAAAHQKLMEAMRAGYDKRMQESLAALEKREQESLDKAAKEAAQAVKHIGELSAAYRGLAAAEDAALGVKGNLKIAQINEEFSKQFEEACEEMKPLVAAEKALAVATAKQETVREQQTRAVEREKVALGELDEQVTKQKAVIEAEIKAGNSTVEARDALLKLEIARGAQAQKLENAERQAEIANLEAATAVRDAQTAVKHANESWEKVVEANEKEIAAMDDLERKQRALADAMGEREKVKTDAKNAIDRNDALIVNLSADLDFLRTVPTKLDQGIAAYDRQHSWLKHNWERDMDGKLSQFPDFMRAMKHYNLERDRLEKSNQRQRDAWGKKAEEIEKKKESHRTKQEKDYLAAWKEWEKYRQNEETLEKQKESLEKEKKDIMERQKELLQNIDKSLEKQGLK